MIRKIKTLGAVAGFVVAGVVLSDLVVKLGLLALLFLFNL